MFQLPLFDIRLQSCTMTPKLEYLLVSEVIIVPILWPIILDYMHNKHQVFTLRHTVIIMTAYRYKHERKISSVKMHLCSMINYCQVT